jgi:hypothetical protein
MLKEKVVSFGDQFAKVYYDNHKLRVVSDPFEARYSRGFWDYTVRSEARRSFLFYSVFQESRDSYNRAFFPSLSPEFFDDP